METYKHMASRALVTAAISALSQTVGVQTHAPPSPLRSFLIRKRGW